MLACTLLQVLVPLVPTGTGAPTPRLQTPGYEVVWRASGAPWIDFVRVEQESPQLRLAVYARDRSLAIWTPGRRSAAPLALVLEPNERFLLSEDRHTLASLRYYYDCLDLARPGLTTLTGLLFREEIAFPPDPQPPLPPDPPALGGARRVAQADDGSLLVFAATGGPLDQPCEVLLLERSTSAPRAWIPTGTYVHPVHGEIQLSSNGSRIAHGTRGGARLHDRTGRQLGSEVGAPVGFRLSPSGDCIAACWPGSVVFHPLDTGGRRGPPRAIPVPSLPRDVSFAGDRAVIRAQDHLLLVEWRTGAVTWQRDAGVGRYGSVHLSSLTPGRLVIAAGRHEVLRGPARRAGVHVDGQAVAHVDVLDDSGRPLLPTASFPTTRWDRSSPRVRILRDARRVLVQTGDLVLVSDPLP